MNESQGPDGGANKFGYCTHHGTVGQQLQPCHAHSDRDTHTHTHNPCLNCILTRFQIKAKTCNGFSTKITVVVSVVVVVVVAAYPNWHKAPERFGSALKERKEREREKKRTADSSNLVVSFLVFVC